MPEPLTPDEVEALRVEADQNYWLHQGWMEVPTWTMLRLIETARRQSV